MQDAHDLWFARQSLDLKKVGKLKLAVTVFFKIVVTIFTSSSLFYLGLFFRVQCDWANRLAVSNRT